MALLVTSFPLEETQSVLEGQGRRRPSRFSPIGYGAGRSAAASVNQGICCAELGWTIACSEWSIGGVESGGETRRESARAVVTGADSMSSISTVSLYKNLGGRRGRIAATPVQRYSMLGCGGAGWVLLLGCAALGVHPVAAEHAAGSSGIMVSGRRAEAVPPGTLPLRAVLRGGSGGLWGNTLQGGSTSLGTSGTFNSGSWSAGDKKAYNPGNDPEVEHCPSDGVTQLAFSPKVLVPKQYLVSSSWDGQLRCWEVEASSGKTSPVGMQRHEKPLMCCTWTADGSGILPAAPTAKACTGASRRARGRSSPRTTRRSSASSTQSTPRRAAQGATSPGRGTAPSSSGTRGPAPGSPSGCCRSPSGSTPWTWSGASWSSRPRNATCWCTTCGTPRRSRPPAPLRPARIGRTSLPRPVRIGRTSFPRAVLTGRTSPPRTAVPPEALAAQVPDALRRGLPEPGRVLRRERRGPRRCAALPPSRPPSLKGFAILLRVS